MGKTTSTKIHSYYQAIGGDWWIWSEKNRLWWSNEQKKHVFTIYGLNDIIMQSRCSYDIFTMGSSNDNWTIILQ